MTLTIYMCLYTSSKRADIDGMAAAECPWEFMEATGGYSLKHIYSIEVGSFIRESLPIYSTVWCQATKMHEKSTGINQFMPGSKWMGQIWSPYSYLNGNSLLLLVVFTCQQKFGTSFVHIMKDCCVLKHQPSNCGFWFCTAVSKWGIVCQSTKVFLIVPFQP